MGFGSSLALVALVVAMTAVLLAFSRPRRDGGRRLPYEPRPLMTANESEFFGRLRRALPGLDVFPQVAMSSIVGVEPGTARKEWVAARARISQKRIDFVICDADFSVIAVVELDDRTHDRRVERDAERDELVAAAGFATIRWDSRRKPSEAEIAAAISALRSASGPNSSLRAWR